MPLALTIYTMTGAEMLYCFDIVLLAHHWPAVPAYNQAKAGDSYQLCIYMVQMLHTKHSHLLTTCRVA